MCVCVYACACIRVRERVVVYVCVCELGGWGRRETASEKVSECVDGSTSMCMQEWDGKENTDYHENKYCSSSTHYCNCSCR